MQHPHGHSAALWRQHNGCLRVARRRVGQPIADCDVGRLLDGTGRLSIELLFKSRLEIIEHVRRQEFGGHRADIQPRRILDLGLQDRDGAGGISERPAIDHCRLGGRNSIEFVAPDGSPRVGGGETL